MNTYTEQRKNKKKKKKELVKCCCSKMFLPESEWEKGWWKGWSAQLANNKWSQAVAVNSKSVTATGNQCDQKLTITGKNSSSNERQSADSADTIDYYRASILYLSLLNDTQDRTSFICRQNTSCLLLFFSFLFSIIHSILWQLGNSLANYRLFSVFPLNFRVPLFFFLHWRKFSLIDRHAKWTDQPLLLVSLLLCAWWW